MYHTQEKWANRLKRPIPCLRSDAWLGKGFYFWLSEVDAIHWGNKSKRNTGYFEIYRASIDCTHVLDTVFNEEQYEFWINKIEAVAKHITIKTGKKPSKQEVNYYIRDKSNWIQKIDGILFQDLPLSEDLLIADFAYRKRVQLVAFKDVMITNFTHHFENACN